MSAFDSLSLLDLQRIWDGVHGRVVHGERITLGVIELDANSVVPEHRHEHEQLGMCLSGSLVFRVGDESRELGPGETWSIPGNVPHEVHVGANGAVVIDVFAPTRDDWRDAPWAETRPHVGLRAACSLSVKVNSTQVVGFRGHARPAGVASMRRRQVGA